MNLADDLSIPYDRALQAEWRSWLVDHWQISAFVTFNSSPYTRQDELWAQIINFIRQAERSARGRNWARFPSHCRPRAVVFFEDKETHIHGHCCIECPLDVLEAISSERSRDWWLQRNPYGQLSVELPRSEERVISYITKRIWHLQERDMIQIYSSGRV